MVTSPSCDSAVVTRAAIVIEVFDENNIEGLKELFERRRRILSFVPKHTRRRAQAQLNKAQERGTVAVWTIYAGNGRPIASSAELFVDEQTAAQNAAATVARVDDIEVLRMHSTATSAFAWYMCIEGHPRVISRRHFSTRRLCDRNAATVMAALRGGTVVLPHERSAQLRGVPALPPGVDDEVLARMAEPLIVRGAERAIRPIVRSYAQPLPRGGAAVGRRSGAGGGGS
ncbi:hypothetical protein [Agreia sp. COWG]|uniref:hypothetical protein n=1 Tax=Agreia sp. COWG TaxID=2773266 RepID=UPI0019263ED8|nr:hypothetical protein [Agreia sp. COWG]CAD5990694.1 conserved protein of unknown function [Agreia sp. COWG]